MRIKMTIGELFDRGLWGEYCVLTGSSVYALNEGLDARDREIDVPPALARQMGFDIPDDAPSGERVELVELLKIARAIAAKDALPWATRYAIIFSEGVKERIRELADSLDHSTEYHDPDGTYSQDVEAFVEMTRRLSEKLRARG
jgi:hypothetical protein